MLLVCLFKEVECYGKKENRKWAKEAWESRGVRTVCVFDRMARMGLVDNVTYEPRLAKDEELSQNDI